METTTNYEKHSTKNPISRFFLNNFLKTVIDAVRSLAVASILDVGCGEGFTLNRLQKEGIGKTLEGVDAVDEALKIGRKLYPKLTLKKGNIYDLQYKASSFDLVLCTEVLEHMDKPEKALQELIRVSKKYVLLTVPNEPWFTYMRIARLKNLLQFGVHPEHVNLWSSSAFEKFVRQQSSVYILTKKHPFPWTMLLLEKR